MVIFVQGEKDFFYGMLNPAGKKYDTMCADPALVKRESGRGILMLMLWDYVY